MPDLPGGTVALTKSIADWVAAVGIADPTLKADLSVDLADILAAARQVERDVEVLLRLPPATTSGAEQALALATNIEVQLFTELSSHLNSLRRAWPKLLERLDAISAADS
jgi:hypothetical protein